jgi:hypothetical protein
MPDNASVSQANDSAVIDEISLYVYQSILEIQQQQPELLREKYRNVAWHNARNRSAFLGKLKEGLSSTNNQEALIIKVQKFLQFLVIPSYFELPIFQELIKKIRSSTQQLSESTNSSGGIGKSHSAASSKLPTSGGLESVTRGIAILLLDAENLQLDANTEKFLSGVCAYPIQIKIAFANWRNMGKQDIEFHGRGYELIHVPAGKDSADVKMSTVGSSIFVHYPTAKEVLVCSSDGVMTHLCTTLQTHGLTVYLVRKQGDTITVLNSKTSQIQTHSLKALPELPSLEQLIIQLKDLIKSEQERTKSQWIELAKISSLFQKKHNRTISQAVSNHFPGKRARDIFIDSPTDFVVHQPPNQSGLYVNLFELAPSNSLASNKKTDDSVRQPDTNPQVQTLNKISSRAELEQILVKMIGAATAESSERYMLITVLGTLFQQQYGQSVTTVIKTLKLNGKFSKFLQSCSAFQLKKTEKGWSVTLR